MVRESGASHVGREQEPSGIGKGQYRLHSEGRLGEITDAVVDTVSGSLVNAVKRTGEMGAALTVAISEVVRGAIQGVAEIGSAAAAQVRDAVTGTIAGVKVVLQDWWPAGWSGSS